MYGGWFRWDYVRLHGGEGLAGFDKFVNSGARATHVNPVFPSNSFPNWHTIVTGLYPESHGIVGNYMYDSEDEGIFYIFDSQSTGNPRWWSKAEPLWITATKNQRDTGLLLWGRCDLPWYGHVLPRHCLPFNYDPSANTTRFHHHLRQAVNMTHQDGYNLVMVYEGAVDTLGHTYGPRSPQVAAAVREVDLGLQNLWNLEARGIMDTTNVVVVSDHGMADMGVKDVEVVELGPCLQQQEVEYVVESGSYVNIRPFPGCTQQVAESVRRCPGVGEKVVVYTKETLPERYHYKANRLIYQVTVIAEPGYFINVEWEGRILASDKMYKGYHGFDNTHNKDLT
ncbi:glycerophosphocholine cholinephosphodiesterase ENPP6-like isoform X2 [Homarus americanus]|uniref:glycerophosphocholine cholinephosphodiesterase ENPP6-like isoform X2 n=1 Tax=Homarus americanus TaxID=6706 RepID=UPI001C45DA34|nr:glycerophosphocholine cholinephosphodiesterase ENPP6-like isoform X2 [Homarus americanus]